MKIKSEQDLWMKLNTSSLLLRFIELAKQHEIDMLKTMPKYYSSKKQNSVDLQWLV